MPYQFRLLQRIFESIRKAGATGLHLAQGERSLLDAFQSAGKAVSNDEVGVLVPLYLFYPAIESFLDSSVKRTIDHAGENTSLEAFDVQLLEVLFLIRYVDEIKGNVDNLVTLCLTEIDADRLALKRKIEESLQRLEHQTLISRNGDVYFFLTNEERDVNREIKAVDLISAEEAKLLGELVFDDVLKGQRKHRFADNKMDFTFNRVCDLHPVGNRVDGGLMVSVVTPLADDYELHDDGKCIGLSSQENGQIVIRLKDDTSLSRELRNYLKTDKYLRTHDDGTLPATTRRIHQDLAADNRQRREHLTRVLGEMLANANYYISGQVFDPKGAAASTALDSALDYLVRNTFTKMNYLVNLRDNPLPEIQALLRRDDVAQQGLALDVEEHNPLALVELRDYLELCTRTSRKVVVHEMINDRFANRPFGWPPLEVALLLTRLYVAGEIQFLQGGAAVPHDRLYEFLSTASKWRSITIIQRVTANPDDVRKARELSHELFAELGPESEDALFAHLKLKLGNWQSALLGFKALADTGNYPGKSEIDAGLESIKSVLAVTESNQFLPKFHQAKDELADLSDDFHDLEHFYGPQRSTWDKLRHAYDLFALNRMELKRDAAAEQALQRMYDILTAPAPYGLLHEAEALIRTVSDVNQALVEQSRKAVSEKIAAQIALVESDLASAESKATLTNDCLSPLKDLENQVLTQESLAHLSQLENEAVTIKDIALRKIAESLARRNVDEPVSPDKPVIKETRVVKPATLSKKAYLESTEDIDAFLEALRQELSDAINDNKRIELR